MSKKPVNLAEIAKLFNFSPDQLGTPEQLQEQSEFEALEDSRDLEAESVIFYMETKDRDSIFKRRTCKLCEKKFLSTYTGVSLCSTECRKAYFESKGMVWNPVGKTEADRWGGTIPKVIGPKATEILQGMTFPEDEILPETSPPVEDEFTNLGNDLDEINKLIG